MSELIAKKKNFPFQVEDELLRVHERHERLRALAEVTERQACKTHAEWALEFCSFASRNDLAHLFLASERPEQGEY